MLSDLQFVPKILDILGGVVGANMFSNQITRALEPIASELKEENDNKETHVDRRTKIKSKNADRSKKAKKQREADETTTFSSRTRKTHIPQKVKNEKGGKKVHKNGKSSKKAYGKKKK